MIQCVTYVAGTFCVVRYRQEVVTDWHQMCKDKDIPVSEKFNLTDTLGEPVKLRDWQIAGLPIDRCAFPPSRMFFNDNGL